MHVSVFSTHRDALECLHMGRLKHKWKKINHLFFIFFIYIVVYRLGLDLKVLTSEEDKEEIYDYLVTRFVEWISYFYEENSINNHLKKFN